MSLYDSRHSLFLRLSLIGIDASDLVGRTPSYIFMWWCSCSGRLASFVFSGNLSFLLIFLDMKRGDSCEVFLSIFRCEENCLSCQGPGTSCTQCKDGYSLVSRTCIMNATCNNGTLLWTLVAVNVCCTPVFTTCGHRPRRQITRAAGMIHGWFTSHFISHSQQRES